MPFRSTERPAPSTSNYSNAVVATTGTRAKRVFLSASHRKRRFRRNEWVFFEHTVERGNYGHSTESGANPIEIRKWRNRREFRIHFVAPMGRSRQLGGDTSRARIAHKNSHVCSSASPPT
jgi:hypothetical protein